METVFKFAVLRPPQAAEPDDVSHVDLTGSESALRSQLKQVAQSDEAARSEIVRVADSYRESDSYVDDPGDLATPFFNLLLRIRSDKEPTIASVKQAVKETAGHDVVDLVQDDQFRADRRRLEDSFLATLVSQPGDSNVGELAAAVRLCGLLDRVAADDTSLDSRGAIHRALKETILLPEEVFPLPPVRPEAGISRGRWEQLEEKATEPSGEVVADGPRLRRALDDLAANSNAEFRAPPAVARRIASADESEARQPQITEPPDFEASGARWVLSEESIGALAPDTMITANNLGIDLTSTPLIEAIDLIQATLAEVVGLPSHPTGQVVALAGTYFDLLDLGATMWTAPYLQVSTQPMSYRPLGIMDLHVVKKTLQRYEPGEVAHIENVLLGESKVRTHRRLSRAEETYTTEQETTAETEKDLQSTERYELEQDSEEVIESQNEKQSDFSLDVTVKYGGLVDITANTKYAQKNASMTAKKEATKSAMSYAREVTETAASRVRERTRTERVSKTIRETEETNVHSVDNTGGQDHVAGIYRWVDKIYEARVHSYGERLMFEFIVPEPGALTIHALANATPEGMTIEKPLPPVDKDGKPLTPEAIQADTYQAWVAQYNVSGVKPPPKVLVTKAFTYKSKAVAKDSDVTFDAEVKDFSLPDGYSAQKAFFDITFATLGALPDSTASITGKEVISLFLGTQSTNLMGSWGAWHSGWLTLGGEIEEIPLHVSATHATQVSISGELLCKCTPRHLKKWQLETFGAIMNAYQNLKSAYDDELESALVSTGINITGNASTVNRALEKTELKKGAISLLIRDRFPHFQHIGSVRNIAKDPANDYWGYPEIDYAEADNEAPIIQFFEQAFEWHHMAYTFYPYFWARKQRWLRLQQITDSDPLFAKFLQAGAARVQVPVRPGYEDDLNLYLLGIEPWKMTGAKNISSAQYLPMVREIMEKEGVYDMKYDGTIDLTNGSKIVTGTGTDFDTDDVRREIDVRGTKYLIASVESANSLTLTRKYRGETETGVEYYIGDKTVGGPWYVRLPTTLVLLEKQGAGLPDFSGK